MGTAVLGRPSCSFRGRVALYFAVPWAMFSLFEREWAVTQSTQIPKVLLTGFLLSNVTVDRCKTVLHPFAVFSSSTPC